MVASEILAQMAAPGLPVLRGTRTSCTLRDLLEFRWLAPVCDRRRHIRVPQLIRHY